MPTQNNTATDFNNFAKNQPTMEDEFLNANPAAKAHFEFIEKQDRAARSKATMRHNQVQEIRDEIETTRERIPNEPDPTKRQKLEATVTKLIAEQNEIAAQRGDAQFGERLRRYATRNRGVPHVALDPAKFDNGKSSAENRKALGVERAKLNGIIDANRTTAEAKDAFSNGYWKKLQDQGAIQFDQLVRGGDFDANGNFRPFTSSHVTFPDQPEGAEFNLSAEDGGAVTGGIHVNITNTLAIMAWLDDGAMLNRICAKIEAFNEGRAQIPMADKPKLIAEQSAKVLHARRVLEASHLREEAEGRTVPRPGDTPPEVLLWVERAAGQSKAPTKEVGSATVKKYPPTKEGKANGATLTAKASVIAGEATGEFEDA